MLEQFVVTEDVVKTGNIMDVKGLHFAIGAAGSGTEGSNLIILEGIGLDPRNDIIPEYLGSSQSVQAIQDGRIDGTSIPAGIPSPAFTELYSGTTKVRHLEITDEQLNAINKLYPAWGPETIKAGTYPNQNEDIKTIRQPNFLAVNADVSEDVVYKLTKTLHENVEYLHQVHSATEQITLESCLVGLPIPLHPGAVKYYKEIGVEIPERLIP
jgi:TRAP transporter TAXI family solute receptor